MPLESGYKNLSYLAALKGNIGKAEIEAAMTQVGLDPTLKKMVGKYSLGMRQKLGIAQAIMEKPDLLLLDEPMNGLDKESVCNVTSLLKQYINDKRTIIVVSHHASDIQNLCSVVYEMDAGRLL